MKRFLALAIMVLAAGAAHGQGVGINTTGAAADTSAILDLSSTTKGLLVPRLTAAQRAAITLPATGLVVYQTDGTAGLYWNAGTPAAPSWKQVGEAGAGGSGQWLTSGSNLYYNTGHVAVGTAPDQFRFSVQDTGSVFRVQSNNPTGVMASLGGFGQVQVDAPNVPGGRLALLGNGNLGLGVTVPRSKLSFAAEYGKKISLFPAGSSDYGLSVTPNRLLIFSDGSAGGDVAIGTDGAGSFNEHLAVRNNGALAVSGSTGAAGQVLQSNGSESAPSWVTPATPATSTASFRTVGTGPVGISNGAWTRIPGLEGYALASKPSNVTVSFSIPVRNLSSTSPVTAEIGFNTWSNVNKRYRYTLAAGTELVASGTFTYPVNAGMDMIFVSGFSPTSPGAEFGTAVSYWLAEFVATVVPQ